MVKKLIDMPRGTMIVRRDVNFEQVDSIVEEFTVGSRLNNIIVNDLLYGVGSRPTLPSCFEDEEELKQDGVDPLSDMRHDSWHDASVAMNPTFQRTEQTIELGSQVETSGTDDTSKDE